jgi:DNA-binding MarR family transcriptional regulator
MDGKSRLREGNVKEKPGRAGATTVWALFLRTHAVVIERIEARLRDAKLPELAWYDVLWALESSGGGRLRMHELAERMVISRSNLTRLADRLESAGLLARDRDPADRRGAFAVLTDKGQDMRQKMWPVYRRAIEEYFTGHLARREEQMLERSFARILDEVG